MVERQIVALEGVGSTPIIHPIFLYLLPDGVGASPSGKARDFDSRIRKVRILPPQPRIELKTSCTLRTRGFCLFYAFEERISYCSERPPEEKGGVELYEEYIGKRVQIELEEESMLYGKYISGQALEYMFADEDEEQSENEILIENEKGLISIRESEIRTIAIVE